MATAEERDFEASLEATLETNDSESESSGDSDDGEEIELSSSAWHCWMWYCGRFQMMSGLGSSVCDAVRRW